MDIINIKYNQDNYLEEYIRLCNLEWGSRKTQEELLEYIKIKKQKIYSDSKVISILALIDKNIMIGFISLFEHDGDEKLELSPWYATMYVKEKYRGKGYSRILNDSILKEAKKLGYKKVYLKSNLKNYYEKFGAKYIEKLQNGEDLFYIDLDKV